MIIKADSNNNKHKETHK